MDFVGYDNASLEAKVDVQNLCRRPMHLVLITTHFFGMLIANQFIYLGCNIHEQVSVKIINYIHAFID